MFGTSPGVFKKLDAAKLVAKSYSIEKEFIVVYKKI